MLKDGEPLELNTFTPGTDIYNAYERCLKLQSHLLWSRFVTDLADDPPYKEILKELPPVVSARILGHALKYAPSDEGRDALAREIRDCGDLAELGLLAYLYVYGLIRVCT